VAKVFLTTFTPPFRLSYSLWSGRF